MLSFLKSNNLLSSSDNNPEPIYLFQQFFIHSEPDRQKEIEFCLQKNIENSYIDQIILLNERIYTNDELSVQSKKIIQKKIKTRLTYKKLFDYINKRNLNGYIVFSNSDIFLDDSINNLRKTDFHKKKNFIALLRYNYEINSKRSKIFGPRFDSQDTWILHTSHIPKNTEVFDFKFGQPGCDNKLVYIMKILGYNLFNVPKLIKTYHVQKSKKRDYSIKDLIPRPHIYFEPYGFSTKKAGIETYSNIINWTDNFKKYRHDDNIKFYNYISEKFANGETFYIPKMNGPELFFTSIILKIVNEKARVDPNNVTKLLPSLEKSYIYCNDINKTIDFSLLYSNSFADADFYTCFEKFNKTNDGGTIQGLNYYQEKYKNKKQLWERVFNIGEFVKYYPWSIALAGKKILVLSPYTSEISKQKNNTDYYNCNLFPGCKITCLQFETKQINNLGINETFATYAENIKRFDFDIMLIDAYGYGNILARFVWQELNKCAINVGNLLPLYFGIYNDKYEKMYPDIIKLYKNEKWIKVEK